jgi:hypothetical protein
MSGQWKCKHQQMKKRSCQYIFFRKSSFHSKQFDCWSWSLKIVLNYSHLVLKRSSLILFLCYLFAFPQLADNSSISSSLNTYCLSIRKTRHYFKFHFYYSLLLKSDLKLVLTLNSRTNQLTHLHSVLWIPLPKTVYILGKISTSLFYSFFSSLFIKNCVKFLLYLFKCYLAFFK